VINVHPSLLPRYRGPSPLPFAILHGDVQTGISIMLLDEGMDTGPILSSKTITIAKEETLSSLIEKVENVGPPLLIKTMEDYLNGSIKPKPQDDSKVTFTHILSREDGRIDWKQSAQPIDYQIRAFTPWPGCWTLWYKKEKKIRIKIIKIQKTDLKISSTPGNIFVQKNHLYVGTGQGLLEILALQIEGKALLEAFEFIHGYFSQECYFE
jgi:methionyl-tRNA formyltransferase